MYDVGMAYIRQRLIFTSVIDHVAKFEAKWGSLPNQLDKNIFLTKIWFAECN